MHNRIPNQEFEDEADQSVFPFTEPIDNKKIQFAEKGRSNTFEDKKEKRLFDIDGEVPELRSAYERKKISMEESKDSKQGNKTERIPIHNITKIEQIEKLAQQFKFDDSVKEIKVKRKENAGLSQIDFSTYFKKGEKVFSDNNQTIFKVIKESSKSKTILKMLTGNPTRFLLLNNCNIIVLTKKSLKDRKEPFTVKTTLCLDKLFQIILDHKEKVVVRLFFFNEKLNPLLPPIQKKYKFESFDKKNEFLRLIKTELEIKSHEMIFN